MTLDAIEARYSRRTAAVMALLFPHLLARSQAQPEAPAKVPDVPYVPTPMDVVKKMLEMGKVRKTDLVYDLGCGDGRIVIAAAKERGARGVGIDIDPQRISEAKANAKEAGVADRVQFRLGDLFETDFSTASVVTLYLLPQINVSLRPQLWQQLKVGTRVVSHAFDMGPEWPPERTERVGTSTIHFWTIRKAQKNAAKRAASVDHEHAAGPRLG